MKRDLDASHEVKSKKQKQNKKRVTFSDSLSETKSYSSDYAKLNNQLHYTKTINSSIKWYAARYLMFHSITDLARSDNPMDGCVRPYSDACVNVADFDTYLSPKDNIRYIFNLANFDLNILKSSSKNSSYQKNVGLSV